MSARLVIFDWDGTLSDSHDGIVAAMSQAFATHALPVPPPLAIRAIIGRALPLAIAELAGDAAHRADAIAATYIDIFAARQAVAPDALFDGAHDLVHALAAQDHVHLAIATGKERRGLDRVLGPTGIGHLFQTLQTADIAASKPHPGMVLNAMALAGTEPEATIMVGDSVLDMGMARAAGVRGIGVAWGSDSPAALAAAGAGIVVEDFARLRGALGEFGALSASGHVDV